MQFSLSRRLGGSKVPVTHVVIDSSTNENKIQIPPRRWTPTSNDDYTTIDSETVLHNGYVTSLSIWLLENTNKIYPFADTKKMHIGEYKDKTLTASLVDSNNKHYNLDIVIELNQDVYSWNILNFPFLASESYPLKFTYSQIV
jgi:hypothetical protein